MCEPVRNIPFSDWHGTKPYIDLCALFQTLQIQIGFDAAKKCSGDKDGLEEEGAGCVEFGGLGSSYATLYKLKPGGHSSISALEITPCSDNANDPNSPPAPQYSCDSDTIAWQILKDWEPTFSKKNISSQSGILMYG